MLTLMVHQKLHKALDDNGQKAVVKLLNSLQQAHDNLSNVAGVIAHLGEILDNEQFTFIMQRAVQPLIQLCIPGNLCSLWTGLSRLTRFSTNCDRCLFLLCVQQQL